MITKIIKKIKNRQFFYRLLSYFSVLLMLTVIIVATTYLITKHGAKQQYYSRVQYNLIQAAEAVDNQVKVVQDLGLNFFSDDVIKHYYKPKDSRTLEMEAEQWRIPRLLQQSMNIFSSTIDENYVFFPGDNQVYTGAGVYEEEFFFEQICHYVKYPKDFWQEGFEKPGYLFTLEPTIMLGANYENGTTVIPVVFRERIAGKSVLYVANLSSDKITKMLKMGSILGDDFYLVLDENDCIMVNTGIEQKKIDTDLLLAYYFSDDHNQTVYKEGKDVYQVFRWIGESGWTYLSITPMKSVNRVMNHSLILVILAGCSALSLGICLVLIFTQKIYQPINQLVDNLWQKRDMENSKDEMLLLQEGVYELQERKEKYEKVKNHYEKKYVEHGLQLELNGISITSSGELENLLKIKYKFNYDYYVCCTVLFDFSLDFYKDIEDTYQEKIFENFVQILYGLIGYSLKCCILFMQKGSYACIINIDDPEKIEYISSEFARMKQVFVGDRNYYTVAVGIGGVCSKIGSLSVSYNQAVYALKTRSQTEEFQVICYDNLSAKRRVSFTFYDQRKIINCIKIGNSDSLNQIVEEILKNNKECGVTKKNMLELYHQIIAVGQRCLEEQELKVNENSVILQIKNQFAQYRENVEYEIIKELILDFLQEVLILVNGAENSNSNQLVEAIKRYINENYMEDMSLDRIGTELGISPKYMSRLFKQNTNQNLTDYISEIRVKKAKELLRTTNKKIGDISLMIGIESRTTFLRVFKKFEGIAPSEYRTIKTSENEN